MEVILSDGARVYDAASGVLLHTVSHNGAPLTLSDVSPDGSSFVTHSEDWSHDARHIQIWDLATGTLRCAIKFEEIYPKAFLAFSQDGGRLLGVFSYLCDLSAMSQDRRFETIVWDMDSGSIVPHTGAQVFDTYSCNPHFPWRKDSILDTLGSHDIQTLDVQTGSIRAVYTVTKPYRAVFRPSYPDQVIVAMYGGAVLILDFPSLRCIQEMKYTGILKEIGLNDPFEHRLGELSKDIDVAVSPAGDYLVVLTESYASILNLYTGRMCPWASEGDSCKPSFSSDGRSVVFVDDARGGIRVWDVPAAYIGETPLPAITGGPTEVRSTQDMWKIHRTDDRFTAVSLSILQSCLRLDSYDVQTTKGQRDKSAQCTAIHVCKTLTTTCKRSFMHLSNQGHLLAIPLLDLDGDQSYLQLLRVPSLESVTRIPILRDRPLGGVRFSNDGGKVFLKFRANSGEIIRAYDCSTGCELEHWDDRPSSDRPPVLQKRHPLKPRFDYKDAWVSGRRRPKLLWIPGRNKALLPTAQEPCRVEMLASTPVMVILGPRREDMLVLDISGLLARLPST